MRYLEIHLSQSIQMHIKTYFLIYGVIICKYLWVIKRVSSLVIKAEKINEKEVDYLFHLFYFFLLIIVFFNLNGELFIFLQQRPYR